MRLYGQLQYPAAMKRLGPRLLRILMLCILVLPIGCAQTIAGMVVKHVAMSAAKNVAKGQYEEYKRRKTEEKAARAAAAARQQSSDRRSPPSDEASDAEWTDDADR